VSRYGNIALDQSRLIAGLRGKEQAALEVLYKQYGGALNGIINRIIGDNQISEEVLQDVIIKIWNKIDLYDEKKGRLFTWMMQLARNSALDKLRSKEISQLSKTDNIDDVVYSVETTRPVTTYIPDIGVQKVLDTLREEESSIIRLVYYQGYTQSEVSKRTGVPLGTVKTRLRMALKNLRNKIKE